MGIGKKSYTFTNGRRQDFERGMPPKPPACQRVGANLGNAPSPEEFAAMGQKQTAKFQRKFRLVPSPAR